MNPEISSNTAESGVVLIVEDSRSISRELERQIRLGVGMSSYVCTTMAEAEAFIDEHGKDVFVAILDLNLPDAENGEVVDLFCERQVPSIVFTANMDENVRREMLSKAIIDYVVKDDKAVSNIIEYIKRLLVNRTVRVLIVEDSTSCRTSLCELLRRHMYQVHGVIDAETGLQVVEELGDIRLVVIDYGLPGMDGVEMTRRIREKFGKDEVAIIGISVTDDPMLSIKFIKSGANDFLEKPFQMEEFFCRVANNVEMVVSLRNLSEAKAVMNRFLGMASHDLRSPINSIKGFTAMLLEGVYGELNEDQTESLEYVQSANNHMRDLVVDLLDMSVIEAGELVLVKAPASICDLIDLRVKIHAVEAQRKGIDLKAERSEIGKFSFDLSRIGQVMDNLLTNAVKFTPEGGSVVVSLERMTWPWSASGIPGRACRRARKTCSSRHSRRPASSPPAVRPAPASACPSSRPWSRNTTARSGSKASTERALRSSSPSPWKMTRKKS